MGTALSDVAFVVVDLETTGGAPGADAITEIGAVRVRGGVIEAEFGTLVNPGRAIPAQITVLTGITNAMVVDAPPVGEALISFLEWARLGSGTDDGTTVLVAHNARFDVGHLRGAARALDLEWTEPRVLDTLALARRAWSRSDVPNHRLGTLASFVGSSTTPTHRALDDAREDLKRCKQRLSKFLLRHGYAFSETTPTGRRKGNWTAAHRAWIGSIPFAEKAC